MATLTGSSQEVYHSVEVRKIYFSDVFDAISKGVADFRERPTHLLFLAIIYPAATLAAAIVMSNHSLLPIVFPAVSGFLLIGPIVALGMYEFSRRREQGEDISWSQGFNFLRSPGIGAISVLGTLLFVVFFLWLIAAMTIYDSTMGLVHPHFFSDFMTALFTTTQGWAMIAIGNVVGLFFALTVFGIGVISFPLILDRHVGVGTAVSTSIRAVVANPIVMMGWAAIVVGSLILAAIPLLVGLAVVFPILGHATWHLYRKVVV
tara:strand:+ start:5188 stop:5973 length:786 start_codon:yes stop_codon:yes gene_type:complete